MICNDLGITILDVFGPSFKTNLSLTLLEDVCTEIHQVVQLIPCDSEGTQKAPPTLPRRE